MAGNRTVVSPGVVGQALNAVGGYPISRLPDLLGGKLGAHAWRLVPARRLIFFGQSYLPDCPSSKHLGHI